MASRPPSGERPVGKSKVEFLCLIPSLPICHVPPKWVKRRLIIMKKIGMKQTVSIAVVNTLFTMLAFIVPRVLELVLRSTISGSMLRTKVREATRTGCKCTCVVLTTVLIGAPFLPRTTLMVNLITRTVPPVESLTAASKLIRKQMLPSKLCRLAVSNVLMMFNGIINTIENGTD